MHFDDNIYKRMNLRQLCIFLLEGLDNFDIENDTYKDRLKKGRESICKRLEMIYQNERELDKATTELFEVLAAYESVYTKIGMKFGARIIIQLLNTSNYAGFN